MTHLKITSLSNDFVGIAYLDDQKIFLENTIPGDFIDTKNNEQVTASVDRITPQCIHYNYCGGCSLQYIKEDTYLNYKNQILLNIITSLKQDTNIVKKPVTIGKYRRRRASFKIEQSTIGYYQEQTHKIFDLKECMVLEPEITNIIPNFREFLKTTKIKFEKLDITLADNGLDLILYKTSNLIKYEIEQINKFASNNKISRISSNIDGRIETIICLNQPFIMLDKINIPLIEGSFLQASKISQKILIDLVVTNLKKFKNILDLYCGIGTYSIPLAQYAKITAIDSNPAMIKHANLFAKGNPKFICRNLHNQPLIKDELNKCDVVVINPPREGAMKQIDHIARSKITNIVMISCNYKTFRRDADLLIKAGYKITQAQMIDQFYYSKHIEIFAYFQK